MTAEPSITPAERDRRRIARPLFVAAGAGWMAYPFHDRVPEFLSICLSGPVWSGLSLQTVGLVLVLNPPTELVFGWVIMIAAMMSPLLAGPLGLLHSRSHREARGIAIALFVGGYAVVWIGAGIVAIGLALVAQVVVPNSPVPLVAALAVAAIWQASPLKQVALNRSQRHPNTSAFAPRVWRDAFLFGVSHGAWCSLSCWALMLSLGFVHSWHIVGMAAATLLIWAERLERPAAPAWRLRWPAKAVRYVLWRLRTVLSDVRTPLSRVVVVSR